MRVPRKTKKILSGGYEDLGAGQRRQFRRFMRFLRKHLGALPSNQIYDLCVGLKTKD